MTVYSLCALACAVTGLASAAGALAQDKPDWRLPANTQSENVQATLQYTARVVRVSDGDSLVLEGPDGPRRVRLAGIDAPEAGQPWSGGSRTQLARLVTGQQVEVRVRARDRYRRDVAELHITGPNGPVHVNLELVRLGAAWACDRRGQSTPDMVAAQENARREGLGLWSLPAAQRVPPWQWRQNRSNGARKSSDR